MEVFLFIMKKLVSAIIFIIMLFSEFNGYAFNNDAITRDEALSIIDKRLNVLDSFENYNAQYREFTNGGCIWLFNFNTKKGTFKNINVFVNSKTGDIVKYELFEDAGSTKDIGDYKALMAAEDFLMKLSPKNLSHYVRDEKIYNGETASTYNFRWRRVENGIQFLHDSIDIAVDRNTGEVVYYSYKWTDGKLSELMNIMDRNEALKLFKYYKKSELVYALLYYNKARDVKITFTSLA